MEGNVKKVLSRLEAQCARREYCSSDVLRKAMEKLDGDTAAAAEVLACLVGGGYVDDFRYASAFARDKASLGGWGRYKIRQALLAKRIGEDVISRALEEVDPDKASARLERLLETKRKSLEGDPQARLKLLKFGLSRGYDYEEVRRFVEEK